MKFLLFLLSILSLSAQGQQVYTDVLKNGDTAITVITPAQFTPATVTRTIKPYKEPVLEPPAVEPPVVFNKIYGFGANATGGTNLVMVSTLSASQIKSGNVLKFTRDATIVGRFEITNVQNLTIDANGYDVTIDNKNNGDGLSIGSGCKNVVVRGIRVINAGNDCINVIGGATDVAIVNCTAYGGQDGSIDIAGGNRVSVIYCLIGPSKGEGLSLVTALNTSMAWNVFYPVGGKAERQPFAHANYSPGVGSPNIDFRQNIVWKHGRYGSGIDYKATGNFVNNYYYSNTATDSERGIDLNADPSSGSGAIAYTSGNVSGRGTKLDDNGNRTTEIAIPEYARIPGENAITSARRILSIVGTAKKTADETKWLQSITIN